VPPQRSVPSGIRSAAVVSSAAATVAPALAESARPPAPQVVPSQVARFHRLAESIQAKPGCADYGIILSIAWPSQPSRTTWLAESLRAEPELRAWLVEGGGVTLSNILHGSRNYGTGRGNREALVLQCSDPERCRALAGFYAQVHLGSKPQPYCGSIPGNTGGPNPVNVEKLLARARPFPHGVCARYRACLVARDQPPASCDGFELSARACADLPDCDAALTCFDQQPRNPKKPLWSDEPTFPERGFF
jgi:hypothetical protein